MRVGPPGPALFYYLRDRFEGARHIAVIVLATMIWSAFPKS